MVFFFFAEGRVAGETKNWTLFLGSVSTITLKGIILAVSPFNFLCMHKSLFLYLRRLYVRDIKISFETSAAPKSGARLNQTCGS